MPSAANVKLEKQISTTENALVDPGNGASTPLRQAITIIEHKIRNLEKRKSKLESYRELQVSGKELNADQKIALAKINEVVMTLDFARDLYKQFLGIATSSEKDAKKQAKRESTLKSQAELARLREILLVQDALNQMGSDSVRDDFLNGRNGAAQLTEPDLKLLDDLYPAVTPKHESGNPTVFLNEVQAAAEHLLAVVDGKQKDIFGGTYSQIKEILGKIHESGYFDQSQEALITDNAEPTIEPETATLEPELNPVGILDNSIVASVETLTIESTPLQPPYPSNITGPPLIAPNDQQVPPIVPLHQGPPVQPPLVIDPAAGVSSLQAPPQEMFFQPATPQPQLPRPITEMLGARSFFFLQDSEVDTPEQIPTQTFTNQTFVVPPPIPMPSHFPAQISPNLPPQMPPNAAPPMVQPPVPIVPAVNEEDVSKAAPQPDTLEKHSLGRNGPRGHGQNAPQFFNNNGYNNRSNRPPPQQHSRNNGVHHSGRAQTNRH